MTFVLHLTMEEIIIRNSHNPDNLNVLANAAEQELRKKQSIKMQQMYFGIMFDNVAEIDMYNLIDLVEEIKYHLENYCNFPNTILQKRSYKHITNLLIVFHNNRLTNSELSKQFLKINNCKLQIEFTDDFVIDVKAKCCSKYCDYSISCCTRKLSLLRVKSYIEKHFKKHDFLNDEYEVIQKELKSKKSKNMIVGKTTYC